MPRSAVTDVKVDQPVAVVISDSVSRCWSQSQIALLRHFGERAIAVVLKNMCFGDEVVVAVVVKISPCTERPEQRLTLLEACNPGCDRLISKSAVART